MQNFNVRPLFLPGKEDFYRVTAGLKVSPAGQAIMAGKAFFYTLQADDLRPEAATILKQEMLARGGEAVLHELVLVHRVERSSCLLCGTLAQYESLIRKIRRQQFGLDTLAAELELVLANLQKEQIWRIPCKKGELLLGKKTLIMGILNVTPDSFSDGGRYVSMEDAVAHAVAMQAAGADIIDIGGESTRPGHTPIAVEEERRRIMPLIEKLASLLQVPISVDTYKPEVARAALAAGAAMVNDIWGLQKDPQMAVLAAREKCPVIVMHNQEDTEYNDLIGDMMRFFTRSKQIALENGMQEEQIIFDPGIGFGKHGGQNLEVLRRLAEFAALGRPLLIGTSRKRFIGAATGLPVTEREWGTAASVVWAIAQGAQIVRVHQVAETRQAVAVADAIKESKHG